MIDYWSKNSVKDLELREELGLAKWYDHQLVDIDNNFLDHAVVYRKFFRTLGYSSLLDSIPNVLLVSNE